MKRDTFKTPWGAEIAAWFRPDTNDWNVLYSCLVEDEYCIADLPSSGVAIDLGMHIGGAALALCSRGYRVIGVEALAENALLANHNLAENGFEQCVLNRAIASRSGQIVQVAYDDHIWDEGVKISEFIGRTTAILSESRTVDVETISLGTVFDRYLGKQERCDFVKCDTEGAEWDAFKMVPIEYLDRIDRIALELHGGSRGDFLALLGGMFDDVSQIYYADHPEGQGFPDPVILTLGMYKHK